ncbi:hypothetical protein PG990_006048 [Apiospora arundinis]|uniref:F-box domain-containing protein n=1 Tax=Apiospora arundinis TaxID=335852 RepID=A0ABR2J924_9PEZI
MNILPPEIVLSILEYCVINHYGDKNSLLGLRTVCRLFDDIIKPYVLRTLQLEFTRLDKVARHERPLDDDALGRIGYLCHALYLDLMLVRDDGEVNYLSKIFSTVPSMEAFVTTLRDRYCLNEASFTEVDYRDNLGKLLEYTPNVSAVRLNLPFQLISKHCRAATMILGNTFEALAQRSEESQSVRTLVLENVTDTTIVKLWRNPRDVRNIIDAFSALENLLISVRRHEEGQAQTLNFRHRLWEMIGKAPNLESLCLISLDWDDGSFEPLKETTQRDCTIEDWHFRSIPTIRKPPKSVLSRLTYLELRRVEVSGCGLISMFKCFKDSLKELYLNQVYLKKVQDASAPGNANDVLWIGLPNTRPPQDHRWIATCLRQMELRLRVCRVASLGYDQYIIGEEPQTIPDFDLIDPSGLGRSLEQRFVEVVSGIQQPSSPDGSPVAYWPEEEEQAWAYADRDRPHDLEPRDWSTPHYFSTQKNPTSGWQKTIDCQFPNFNQFTLDELHWFADTACKGMNKISRAMNDDEDPQPTGHLDAETPGDVSALGALLDNHALHNMDLD